MNGTKLYELIIFTICPETHQLENLKEKGNEHGVYAQYVSSIYYNIDPLNAPCVRRLYVWHISASHMI